MHTQEDSSAECWLLVHVNISLHELQPAHPIVTVPGCLADFDVLACGANAMVLFGVHPNCGLMRGLQQYFQRSTLPNFRFQTSHSLVLSQPRLSGCHRDS